MVLGEAELAKRALARGLDVFADDKQQSDRIAGRRATAWIVCAIVWAEQFWLPSQLMTPDSSMMSWRLHSGDKPPQRTQSAIFFMQEDEKAAQPAAHDRQPRREHRIKLIGFA
jgi:hypothetical protein